MSISILQALLLGVIYYLGNIGTPWTTVLGSASIFQKPLVAGLLTGIVLGHPLEGLLIGAAIQLPYISYISAGSTVPSDPGLAGVVGTCLAICGGFDPLAAIAIGIPFGLVGTKIWVYHMTVDAKFVHKADKAAGQSFGRNTEIEQPADTPFFGVIGRLFYCGFVMPWRPVAAPKPCLAPPRRCGCDHR